MGSMTIGEMKPVIGRLCLGLSMLLILGAEVWLWQGGLVRLHIPLAGAAGFPIPILYWMAVILYGAWGGARVRVPGHSRWRRTIQLGFFLHLLMLMAHLVWSVHQSPQHYSSLYIWYLRYWQLIWAAALAFGAAALIGRASDQRDVTFDPVSSQGFWWPLAVGYVMFWLLSLTAAPLVALGSTAIGMGLWAANRDKHLKGFGRRAVQFLQREPVLLTGVFFIALALRVFYILRVMTSPAYLDTGSDGRMYDALAWAYLQGVEDPRWGPCHVPGYVRFLSLCYAVVGRNYFWVCVIQAAFGAVACLLLYDVVRRLIGVRAAQIATLFGAVDFLMVFSAAGLGHQAMDIFWTMMVVWCLVRYLDDPQRLGKWMIAIGCILGWAILTREGNLPFYGFLLLWFLIGVRARLGWRRALLHLASLSLGVGLIVAPFMTSGWPVNRVGYYWFYIPTPSVHINQWFNPWRDPAGAWAVFHAQPWLVIWRLLKGLAWNFQMVFLHQDFGSFDLVFLFRRSLFSYGMWWYAYLLTLVGAALMLWRGIRQPVKRLGTWLVMGLLVSRSAVHLLLEASYRHRAPLEPYLIMLAAYGLMWFVRRNPADSPPSARSR